MSFWRLITEARLHSTDCCEVTTRAIALAVALPPPDIVALHQEHQRLLHDSYVHRLWAAANVMMMGFCSDDSFDYFRAWLLTCGPDVYAAALATPDSLADQLRPSWLGYQCEDALYIASTAYQRSTGSALPAEAYLRRVPDIDWEFDLHDEEELKRRLPRLTALFLH